MANGQSALRVYIDYDYLTARQLGDLLLGLHGVFDELLYAKAPSLRALPGALESWLRVSSVDTGGSIVIYLTQGITQMMGSADPSFLVEMTSGAAALLTTGNLCIRLARRIRQLRAEWRLDNRTDEFNRLVVEGKRIEVSGKREELEAQRRRSSLEETKEVIGAQWPDLPPGQLAAVAEKVQEHLDALGQTLSGPNIIRVEVTLPPEEA